MPEPRVLRSLATPARPHVHCSASASCPTPLIAGKGPRRRAPRTCAALWFRRSGLASLGHPERLPTAGSSPRLLLRRTLRALPRPSGGHEPHPHAYAFRPVHGHAWARTRRQLGSCRTIHPQTRRRHCPGCSRSCCPLSSRPSQASISGWSQQGFLGFAFPKHTTRAESCWCVSARVCRPPPAARRPRGRASAGARALTGRRARLSMKEVLERPLVPSLSSSSEV